MKLPHIILLLAIVSSVLCGYQLPDLGINNQEPNCQNAADLLTAANSDISRLTKFVNQDLPQSIQNAQQALSLTQQACQIQNSLRPQASFLQTQISSSSSKSRLASASVSQLNTALKDHSTRMSSQHQHDESDLHHTLIADKATKVSTMLLQLSDRRAPSPQDNCGNDKSASIDSACANAKSTAQNLVDYLNYLSSQVTERSLNADLPQRISNLNKLIADCAAPITQTGQFERVYYATPSPLATTANQVRTDDVTVTFNQAFASVPSVGIALTGLDIYRDSPNLQVVVLTVTTTSFVFRVTANPGVALYMVQVSYIATLSDRSGIYIVTTNLNKANDADLSKISAPIAATPTRTLIRALTPPSNLKNVKSMAFIRSFEFGTGRNLRLEVFTSADSNSINYQTWSDTLLNGVATTILFWSGNDTSITTKSTATTVNGVLAQGSGLRSEKTVINTGAYTSSMQLFFGIYHFDGIVAGNYRLKQEISGTDSSKTLTSSAWSDTKLYQVVNGFVMSCSTINKAQCLLG